MVSLIAIVSRAIIAFSRHRLKKSLGYLLSFFWTHALNKLLSPLVSFQTGFVMIIERKRNTRSETCFMKGLKIKVKTVSLSFKLLWIFFYGVFDYISKIYGLIDFYFRPFTYVMHVCSLLEYDTVRYIIH